MKKAMSLVSLLISAAFACPAFSASPHGLDDSNTDGANGYKIASSGEAFLGGNWPKNAVWQRIWDVCNDTGCDGSFQIGSEWAVCEPGSPGLGGIGGAQGAGGLKPGSCSPKDHTVTVTVKGDYGGQNGWDTRAAFMDDLMRHDFGDGGVYHNGDAAWGNGFGYPPGWWVAGLTYIRRQDGGPFWVNISIN